MPYVDYSSDEVVLFNELKAVISAKLPEIKHVARWNNQLKHEKEEIPFNYPAIFIEFNDYVYRELSGGQDEFDMTVRIRLAFETYKQDDIEVFTMNKKIRKTFRKFDGTGFVPFISLTKEADWDHDNRELFINDFRTGGVEFPGEDSFIEIPADTVDLEINEDLKIDNTVIRTGSFQTP